VHLLKANHLEGWDAKLLGAPKRPGAFSQRGSGAYGWTDHGRVVSLMEGTMVRHGQQSGFSIIEVLVGLAIFAIVAGFSVPNVQQWMRNYRLKSAVMDLHSNMQLAKAGAIKDNRPWKIQFNAAGTYTVIQCLTNTCETGTAGTDYRVSKTVNLATAYGNEALFKHPTSSIIADQNPLAFSGSGLTDPAGHAYISNRTNSSYYRIGTRFIAAGIRVERWDGSNWN
jgi:prepilin-type N-terminal cleavage/methylation domain-containing protein